MGTPVRVALGRMRQWLKVAVRQGLTRFMRQRQSLMALELATLVGLCALIYLSQLAAVTSAHQTLLDAQNQLSVAQQHNAEAHAELGREQSPSWIDQQARAQGLIPALPQNIVWLTIHLSGR